MIQAAPGAVGDGDVLPLEQITNPRRELGRAGLRVGSGRAKRGGSGGQALTAAPACLIIIAAGAAGDISMGRIFERRKTTMFARWDRMAKQFARCAKELTIAAKRGIPDPAANPALRRSRARRVRRVS